MRERSHDFSPEIKKQVREAQNDTCAFCGRVGCLQIHHIIPKSLATEHGLSPREVKSRENAVGLCPCCHQHFDDLALNHGKFYHEVLMEAGREYDLYQDRARVTTHLTGRASGRPGSADTHGRGRPGTGQSAPPVPASPG